MAQPLAQPLIDHSVAIAGLCRRQRPALATLWSIKGCASSCDMASLRNAAAHAAIQPLLKPQPTCRGLCWASLFGVAQGPLLSDTGLGNDAVMPCQTNGAMPKTPAQRHLGPQAGRRHAQAHTGQFNAVAWHPGCSTHGPSAPLRYRSVRRVSGSASRYSAKLSGNFSAARPMCRLRQRFAV